MDFPTLESFDRSTVYLRGGQLPHQQKSRGAWSVWPRKLFFSAKRRKTNSRRILESFLPSLQFFYENSARQEKCGSWPPPLSSQTIKVNSHIRSPEVVWREQYLGEITTFLKDLHENATSLGPPCPLSSCPGNKIWWDYEKEKKVLTYIQYWAYILYFLRWLIFS